ncbi:MAG: c-type cytochrome [Rectinemataceae bacterium]
MIESIYGFLASVGYTDPIHAPMTHLPIGLSIGAFIFFVVAIVFKRKRLVITARHVSILALIFVFPTILFGVFDWIHFYHGVLMPAIRIKMTLAAVLLVLLGFSVILGSEIKLHALWMTITYALCVGIVVALGWFGAGIIYGRDTGLPNSGTTLGSAGEGSSVVVSTQSANLGDAKAGQVLFANNCQACHAGGENLIVPSLPIRGSKPIASFGSFLSFIRAPKMPDGSAGAMPPFGPAAITDARARDLYVYVSTAWK